MAENVISEGAAFSYKNLDVKSKIKEIAIVVAFAMVIGGIWISFLLFVGGGININEYYQKHTFYSSVLLYSAVFLLCFSVLAILTKGKFDVVLHDPEQGILKDFPFLKNPFILTLIALGMGIVIGLFSALKNTFFVGIPPQTMLPELSITNSELLKVFFSSEPAAIAETFLFLCFLSLITTLFNFLIVSKKYNGLSRKVYYILIPFISVIVGLLWVGYHSIAYSGQDAALLSVFIFGFIGALVTLYTQTFLIWWAIHNTANAFVKLNELFSDDIIKVYAVVGLLLIGLLLVLISLIINKKRVKNE